jgi:hypothetical protein
MTLRFALAVIRQTCFKNVFISVDDLIALFHQPRKDAMAKKRYSYFNRL